MFSETAISRTFPLSAELFHFSAGSGSIKKFPNALSNERAGVFKRKMACINQVQFSIREIPFVGFGSFDGEKWVVLPPENQHSWLPAPEIFMPTIIERDIRLIVVKKIELNCGIAWTIEKQLVHRVGIRADSFRVAYTMRVLKHGHLLRQEIPHWLLSFGVAIGPEWLHRVECAANPLRV